jgi:hypothetical protein
VGYLCNVTWGCLITCFAFQESNNVVYLQMWSSLMDQLHEQEFTSLILDVLLDVVCACLCSYTSLIVRAWLLACPSTPSFCLSSTHFLTTLHISLSMPHPMVPHLSWCQCGHTIDDLGIHLLHCSCRSWCTTTHDTFQNTVTTIALKNRIHVQKEVFLFP